MRQSNASPCRVQCRTSWIAGAVLLLGMVLVPGHQAIAMQADASTDDSGIEGDWLVQSRDAIIRIERQGDTYEGRIVWQLHDTYGPEDGPALDGKIVTDRNNPDPSLRDRPLTGLRLLWGLRYDPSEHRWVDGEVYNADNGKVYHCQIRLLDPDRLSLHGYIGITLLGGNTTWTRSKGPLPAVSASGGLSH